MTSRRRVATPALRRAASGRADAVVGGRATSKESRATAEGGAPNVGGGGRGLRWLCEATGGTWVCEAGAVAGGKVARGA
jgi:hypothetical protein